MDAIFPGVNLTKWNLNSIIIDGCELVISANWISDVFMRQAWSLVHYYRVGARNPSG